MYNLGVNKAFLSMTWKLESIKEKGDKFSYMKMRLNSLHGKKNNK